MLTSQITFRKITSDSLHVMSVLFLETDKSLNSETDGWGRWGVFSISTGKVMIWQIFIFYKANWKLKLSWNEVQAAVALIAYCAAAWTSLSNSLSYVTFFFGMTDPRRWSNEQQNNGEYAFWPQAGGYRRERKSLKHDIEPSVLVFLWVTVSNEEWSKSNWLEWACCGSH